MYYQAYGTNIPIWGHWVDPKQAMMAHYQDLKGNENNTNNTHSIGPFFDRIDFAWTHDWLDAIRHQVSKIQPDVLVLNAGNGRRRVGIWG